MFDRVKEGFYRITLGNLTIIITILYAVIIFLVNDRQTRIQNRFERFVETENVLNDNMESRMEHMEWYREQGIDFSKARKLDIKPRTKAESGATTAPTPTP